MSSPYLTITEISYTQRVSLPLYCFCLVSCESSFGKGAQRLWHFIFIYTTSVQLSLLSLLVCVVIFLVNLFVISFICSSYSFFENGDEEKDCATLRSKLEFPYRFFSSQGKQIRLLMMGEQSKSESMSTKPKTVTREKKKKSEFEFCKVCNINHDQGLRHKYFPKHKNSLSTFLSRFRNKLSDVRFFLNSPIPISSELASHNRFWCVFCDQDISELSSSFACANAIHHLASVEHVKNLKHFFWKYGGSMDQLDAFTVSDNDVAKWEKRCIALKNEAVLPNEGSSGAVFGHSSDIHNQLNNGNIDSFENIYSHSVKSYPSNAVLPLHCYTNEYQVSSSGLSGVGNTGLLDIDNSSLPSGAYSSANPFALQDFAVERITHSLPCNGGQRSSDGYSCNKAVLDNGRMVSGESSQQGLQMLTRISSVPAENDGGNVHSGAPPPWFEATEGVQTYSKPVLGNLVSHSNKSGKSKKLNPKRVGAAWAEKRKIEIEMEKRGEIVMNECDANWLPNFGRVWQSGSRRESRKEFEREKQELLNVETQSDMPIKIQPYVSKRMRMDSGGDDASG